MTVLVSDTSVLIDLERGNLLEWIFSLPYEFAVPDVLHEREIAGQWGDRLKEHGLRVERISPAGVRDAIRFRQTQPALSIPDAFALALAKERCWMLLTGDARLREIALVERVECHGLLWLMDRMEELGRPGTEILHEGLLAISRHPRCRLPRREVAIRLKRYGGPSWRGRQR